MLSGMYVPCQLVCKAERLPSFDCVAIILPSYSLITVHVRGSRSKGKGEINT